MNQAEILQLVTLLAEELDGLGPFGEVTLRIQVRSSRIHRAEASRTRSVMLVDNQDQESGMQKGGTVQALRKHGTSRQ